MKATKRSIAMKKSWAERRAKKYADEAGEPTLDDLVAAARRAGAEVIVALDDPVNHPAHYTSKAVECITITENMNFCVGNAMKYLWRAGEKGDYVIDLQKAAWYIAREIARVSK